MKFPEQSLQALHLFEPALEFAYGQMTAHPKDGLFLYGPHMRPNKTKEIRIGVVGTANGINHFRSWAEQIKKRVDVPPPGKGEKKDRLHLANFPGIEEAFAITFNEKEFVTYPIDLTKIDKATRILNCMRPLPRRLTSTRSVFDATSTTKRVLWTYGFLWCPRSSSNAASPAQNGSACRRKRAISAKSKSSALMCRCSIRSLTTMPRKSSMTLRIFIDK